MISFPADALAHARSNLDLKTAVRHRSQLLRFVCELTGRELTLEGALGEATTSERRYPERLAIRDGSETNCVAIVDIDWIDAAGDYMCVHVGDDTHILRGTMKRLEEVLDPGIFVRVHRSAIVNRRRVTAMRPHRNGEYFLKLGQHTELKLSRKYKGNLSKLADRL